jgi:hypothetical protein
MTEKELKTAFFTFFEEFFEIHLTWSSVQLVDFYCYRLASDKTGKTRKKNANFKRIL